MRTATIVIAALLGAGCAHQSGPGTPVHQKGHASPELMERVDRGEFKAYEVDPNSCPEVAAQDRQHQTIIGSCPSKP